MKAEDLTGKRFGRRLVLSMVRVHNGRRILWECRCDCGHVSRTSRHQLRTGDGRCVKCRAEKHGGSTTPEYKTWLEIKQRCNNPRDKRYPGYGGRGIALCVRWLDFALFIDDMGPRPTPQHSIDRIDNNRGYEPGNCRWATKVEQARNTRHNTLLTVNGETRCVMEWSERVGILPGTLFNRLKSGWSHEKAVLTPVDKCRSRADSHKWRRSVKAGTGRDYAKHEAVRRLKACH